MGKIVARVDKEGIVRYTGNPATAKFAGMYIDRCVSPKGKVVYYFLKRKTRENTGWNLSQEEYDAAMRVGAFIPVATRTSSPRVKADAVPEPKYYQKSHDYETGRTVGNSRTPSGRSYRTATQQPKQVRSQQAPQNASANTQVVLSQGSLSAAQLPDNTAGFSMSYASNSEFFHEDTPSFNTDVLQDVQPVRKKGVFSRFIDGLKSFFLKPVVEPPTVMALPAAGESTPIDNNQIVPTPGRHYRSQGADVPMIPRGRN